MKNLIAMLWDKATPDEPGVGYLATLMGIAIVVFAIAYVLGPL